MPTLKAKISNFLRTEKNKRDALQQLIVECIADGQQAGDSFDNLSALVRGLIELKSRNTNAIREYVRDHVSNITWAKDKAGNFRFVKATKGEACVYKEVTYPWYNQAGNLNTNTNKEVSVASVKQYFKTLRSRMSTNGVKDEDAEKLETLLAQAEATLA